MRAYPIVQVVIAHEDRLQRTTSCRLFRKVQGVQCDVANAIDLEGLEPADLVVLGPDVEIAIRQARKLRDLRWRSVIVNVGVSNGITPDMKACGLQALESLDEEAIASLLDRSKFLAPDPLEFAAHFLRANLDRTWWTTVAIARVILALRRTHGNKNAAAAFLGLKPQHLRKILDEHRDDALAIALEFGVPRAWVELDPSRSGSHAIDRRSVAKR